MKAPLALEAIDVRKRFGAVVALNGVSLKVRAGSVHALLGENGAGKSTLVKCLTGYYTPDDGQFLVNGRELANRSPREALRAGIGMVYQHFTLVPGMTVAENLLLARPEIPFALRWRGLRRELQDRLAKAPFQVALDAECASLSAGEKQKVEILKQLLMNRRLLVLDEPSSVLTPEEADDVLGALRREAAAGRLSVVLITHKFREVRAFADDVTVLRHGAVVGSGPAAALSDDRLAEMMIGASGQAPSAPVGPRSPPGAERLRIAGLTVRGSSGARAVDALSLSVASGDILGIAGVSGNGQRELVEALAGQRAIDAGAVHVGGEPFAPSRRFMSRHRIAVLPEEPLRNACVANMSVAENLALRAYDEAPLATGGPLSRWLMRPARVAAWARDIVARNAIKTAGTEVAVKTLSGGNVQRLVLARELGERPVDLLIASNPCFGLDFAAAARIRERIRAVRDAGAAVLLISEDLDEILDIADRIAVMSSGRIVLQTSREAASRQAIGGAMAGMASTKKLEDAVA